MSLIDVRNLSFSYEGSAETVFENVSFQLDTNWRLGLVGRNGRGKTTLLRLLQGALPCGRPDSCGWWNLSIFPMRWRMRKLLPWR